MSVEDANNLILSTLETIWNENKNWLCAIDPDFTFDEFCFEFFVAVG